MVRRELRALLLVVLSAFVLVLPRSASAWVELHVARDDIRLTIDSDGSARVEHKLLLLVSGGPLTSFEVTGIDPDAALEEGAFVVAEKDDKAGNVEGALPLYLKRVTADGTLGRADLHVDIDGGRGISRGRFVAVIRYRTDLLARGILKLEGTSARLDWVGPAWPDGLESTKAVFSIPTAPAAPKAADASDDDATAVPGGTFLEKLTRKSDRDSLELIRPYASKGERVVWSLRFDARAIDGLLKAPAASSADAPKLVPPDRRAPLSPLRLVSSAKDTLFMLGALSIFVLVAALVAAHAIEVRQRCARRDQKARPLIPVPIFVRAVLAGVAFVAGLWLELHEPTSLKGALVVALVVPLCLHRTAVAKPALRGPGSWLCIRMEEALAGARPRPRGVFEPTSISGAVLMTLLVGGFIAAAEVVARRSLYHGILVGLDVVPLLAMFATGRESSLVPDPAVDPIPLYDKVVRRIRRRHGDAVRIVPKVRVPKDQPDPDEIRFVFLPQRPVKGLRALELAVAYAPGPTGYVALPEVLLRFEEGSACESLVHNVEGCGRVQRGRRIDERVLSLTPRLPTAGMTADLLSALLERLAAPAAERSDPDAASKKSRRAPARALPTAAPPLAASEGA